MPQNQQGVASTLNTYFNSGGALPPSFVALYRLTGSNLSNALGSLTGEAATGTQQVAFESTRQFLDVMLDPTVVGRSERSSVQAPALAFAPDRALPESVGRAYASVLKPPASAAPAGGEPPWTSWASAFGGYNRLAGDPTGAGTQALSARIAGVAASLDYSLSPETILGVALAGGGTNWGLSQGLGTGRCHFFQAGTYASTRSGPAYLSSAFGFANHWASTARFVAFGDHLAGSFAGQSYGGRVEGGYHLAAPEGFTPYAAAQAQGFVMPAYTETGASGGFGLSYKGRTATDTRVEVGARLDHAVALDAAAVLALRARLAFAQDWVSNPTLAAGFATLPGTGFMVAGAKPVTNAALVSGGVELHLRDGVTIGARFDGEFASRASVYAGTGLVRFTW